jgi:hypothetical protein
MRIVDSSTLNEEKEGVIVIVGLQEIPHSVESAWSGPFPIGILPATFRARGFDGSLF